MRKQMIESKSGCAGVSNAILASLIYGDVARVETPARLVMSEPAYLQVRIVEKRNYWLNLCVCFGRQEQRAAVSELVGGAVGQPGNKGQPPGTPDTFRVVVYDQNDRTVHERTVKGSGRENTRARSLGRRIDEFVLSRGSYRINVTPLSDVSKFSSFRSSLELTYQPRSTSIQE